MKRKKGIGGKVGETPADRLVWGSTQEKHTNIPF